MRVLMLESAFSAAPSRRFSSASMSSGLMTSGLNLIWNEALAGQISVTPLIRLSFTAVVIERLLKKACSDISSSTSTKMCSSPPKEYRVFMIAPPPTVRSLCGQLGRIALEPAFQPAGMELRRLDRGIARQCEMQRTRGLDAADLQLMQGANEARDSRGTVFVPDDQFSQQRIVKGRNGVTLIEQAVEAHAIAAGNAQLRDGARRGHEILGRILGI